MAFAPERRQARRRGRVIANLELSELQPIDPDVVQILVAEHSRPARILKRTADIVCAVVGLLLTAPLLALLALIIRIDSRGSVIYRQLRMGHNQKPFTVVKLRTMNDRGQITRAGRLMRPTGLDEIPQLWNVLCGEMSIVGPRPEVLDRVPRWEREIPGYWARHLMRPGITGWAQVNGLRGHVSIAKRLQLDLHYISSWSLVFDLRILFRTLGAVWRDTRSALRS
jgi:lipopolysaccharide/colanic/teichoic acid biosynthesis glycosyltransferase